MLSAVAGVIEDDDNGASVGPQCGEFCSGLIEEKSNGFSEAISYLYAIPDKSGMTCQMVCYTFNDAWRLVCPCTAQNQYAVRRENQSHYKPTLNKPVKRLVTSRTGLMSPTSPAYKRGWFYVAPSTNASTDLLGLGSGPGRADPVNSPGFRINHVHEAAGKRLENRPCGHECGAAEVEPGTRRQRFSSTKLIVKLQQVLGKSRNMAL